MLGEAEGECLERFGHPTCQLSFESFSVPLEQLLTPSLCPPVLSPHLSTVEVHSVQNLISL